MMAVYNFIKNKFKQGLSDLVDQRLLSAGLLVALFVIFSGGDAFAQETINTISNNVVASSVNIPGLVSAVAYIFGIIAGVLGILKLRQHVENPTQNPISQALIRFAVGGALFALPIIYEAAYNTFNPGGPGKTAPKIQDTLDSVAGKGGGGTNELNNLAENVITASDVLPGLIIAAAYLLGLVMVVTALLRFKEAVDVGGSQPTVGRTAIRSGIVRILVAGMLFAMPTIAVALDNTIGNGTTTLGFDNAGVFTAMQGVIGTLSILEDNFNNVLNNILDATSQIPGLLSAVAYMLGLVMLFAGLLKIRDHVENPEQTTIKEPITRLLTAGALFAMPAIYNAMYVSFGSGGVGVTGIVGQLAALAGFARSALAEATCNLGSTTGVGKLFGTGISTGELVCDIAVRAGMLPAFLNALAYVLGLVLGVWGVLKVRDHVLNPQQTKLWEGVSRLAAGGLFFALPVAIEVAKNTFVPGTAQITSTANMVSNYNTSVTMGPDACAGGIAAVGMGGLDAMLGCFMGDMMAPLHTVLTFFAYCAGIIFIMIGVSRLIKSAQDGARGPGGLGTIATFAIGGMLLSFNGVLQTIGVSLFGARTVTTNATISYTKGMTGAEADAAHTVLTSIIQFMIVIGIYSFVRGLFIIRGVAEGNQQSSIMAGMTHLIGGALAVNLGPLINAVQRTLGIDGFGIVFA